MVMPEDHPNYLTRETNQEKSVAYGPTENGTRDITIALNAKPRGPSIILKK